MAALPERKALIRNLVAGIEIVGDEAALEISNRVPPEGPISEPVRLASGALHINRGVGNREIK